LKNSKRGVSNDQNTTYAGKDSPLGEKTVRQWSIFQVASG